MTQASSARAEWRSGWPLVLSCTLGQTLVGVGFVSAGTFMAPIQHAFGWTKAEFSSAFIAYVIPGTILAPIVGVLLDRYGSRAVALPGLVMMSLVVALFSTLNGSLLYWMALWLLLATAGQFIMHTIWAVALAGHFDASRKMALSILSMANGITLFIAPLLANFLIERNGWQHAYLFLGFGWGGLGLLVNFFLLHDQRSRRVRARTNVAAPPSAEVPGVTVKQGLRSAAFARITASTLICNLLNIALAVHMVEILTHLGLARDTAVLVASSYGIWMLIGNIAFGVIGDNIPAKLLGATVVAAPAMTCALLVMPTSSWWQPAIAIMIFGLSCGMQGPAYTYLSTRHFGLKNFGTLRGFMASGLAIAAAISPYIAGRVYDETKSYDGFLLAGIPPLLIAGLLLLTLAPYPKFEPATS